MEKKKKKEKKKRKKQEEQKYSLLLNPRAFKVKQRSLFTKTIWRRRHIKSISYPMAVSNGA